MGGSDLGLFSNTKIISALHETGTEDLSNAIVAATNWPSVLTFTGTRSATLKIKVDEIGTNLFAYATVEVLNKSETGDAWVSFSSFNGDTTGITFSITAGGVMQYVTSTTASVTDRKIYWDVISNYL